MVSILIDKTLLIDILSYNFEGEGEMIIKLSHDTVLHVGHDATKPCN